MALIGQQQTAISWASQLSVTWVIHTVHKHNYLQSHIMTAIIMYDVMCQLLMHSCIHRHMLKPGGRVGEDTGFPLRTVVPLNHTDT